MLTTGGEKRIYMSGIAADYDTPWSVEEIRIWLTVLTM